MSPAAVRLNDPVAHVPLWAGIAKMVGGLAVAAAVGAAAVGLAVAVVGTGGLGAVVASAVLSSAIMALGGNSLVDVLTQGLNKAIDALFPAVACGAISAACSMNVFINGIPAAHALPANLTACGKHSRPKPFVAEGSDNVCINAMPAHRVGDSSTCGAKANSGSPNVFIGGGSVQIAEIAPEEPPWLQYVGTALGIATALCSRNWKAIPAKLGCLATMMGISMATEAAVSAVIGHPVHAASGAKILDGGEDTDFALPARLPLEWKRRYSSLDARVGLLGQGWSTPESVQLKLNAPGEYPILFIDEMGREVPFEALSPGQSLANTVEGLRLCCTEGGHYIVEIDDGSLYYDFGPPRLQGAHTLDLFGLEDRNGNVIHLYRDGTGRLLGLADSAGRHYRCHYDTAHPERLSGIELDYGDAADGAQPDWLVRYTYDPQGRLSTVANRKGEITRRFTWHNTGPGRNLMASHSLPEGLTAYYRWDAFFDHPRVVEQWDGLGNRWQIEYDTTSGTTQATDQRGCTQNWRWDGRYELLGHTDAVGNAWQIERNDDGQIVCAIQPNGGRWQLAYDQYGSLASQTDPTGAVTRIQWRYQTCVLPETETDALGNVTAYVYDDWGNLVETRDARGTTAWTLDRHGQPLIRTAPGGSTARWAWNDAGQITQETDCSGNTTRYEYDRDGNLLSLTDPLGHRTQYHHDPLGRLLKAELPDGTSRAWAWDVAGQLVREADGKGGVTAYEREHGRLTRRVDAAGRAVSYWYDAPGNLSAIDNENGESIRFEHDAADRTVAQVGLDGKRTETELDALGWPIRVTEAAGTPHAIVTGLERDLLGRLVKKATPDTITAYTRDALGRVTRIERANLAQEPIDALEFAFDAAGNLTAETQTLYGDIKTGRRAEKRTLTHAYDALGNRTCTTLPDGRAINNLYYGSGHLHQVNLDGRVVCDFERDALHRETLRTQGALTLHTQYDPLSRILARVSHPLISHAPSPEGLNKRYQYDAGGELARRADSWLGEVVLRHDPTGRILGARHVGAGRAGPTRAIDEEHAYDPAANLLSPYEYAPGLVRHNRLLVFEDKRYQYDDHGRLIEKRIGRHTTLRLKWNREHQLVESSIERGDRLQSSYYEYDALGRRVRRYGTSSAEAHFIWDGMRLLQEKRGSENTTYVYQPGSHEPLARIDDREASHRHPTQRAAVYHFHTHINGAPEELTDESGQTLWRARYRTWGNLALEEDDEQLPQHDPWAKQATKQPIRMQGQYADPETGLYYNTFRYYDPDIGRFVTEDPIGVLGGINLYQYAANADGWVDPWGWACFKAKRTQKGVEKGSRISKKEAIRRVRSGEDVLVSTKQEAKAIARAAEHGKPMMHAPHPNPTTGSTAGRLPHAHPNQHSGTGHIFYGD
ncbi:MAG: DUF6531 domain-containing protein [Betaproteobacteria bacterium]|nr:DUF6531 domain-containing protein [Betaproteobacteria bacterium]